MPVVELGFSALPGHVRTARLVAAAFARRVGVDEELLHEIRLAVGEACSRAVTLHRRNCPGDPVTVRLSDDSSMFEVVVIDQVPGDVVDGDVELPAAAVLEALPGDPVESLPANVGLAVVTGLVDEVKVESGPDGTAVTMSWRVGGQDPL
jgi:serine/threonine-protein kinase RsbW